MNLAHINRIAIVGNAPTVLSENKGDYIDGFDCVVRLTNYDLSDKYKKHIGSKTDLYSFYYHHAVEYENRISDINLCVVNPFLIEKHKYKEVNNLTVIDRNEKEWFDIFGEQPTSGIRTIHYLSQFDFDEMYITGFSFESKGYSYYFGEENEFDQFGHNLEKELDWLKRNRKEYMIFDKHINTKLK